MTDTHNRRADPLDHLAVAGHWARRPDDWPTPPRFDPAERWYHRMFADDDHEVWLLTWLPGQGTELHDHGGSAGGFTVTTGRLAEYTVAGTPMRTHRAELAAGTGRRFGPRHVHRVINEDTEPAISVHVYSPALTRMTRYELTDSGLAVAAVDLAGAQW